MAAKKKRVPPACTHVGVDMVAYIAGTVVGPDAGDHTAVMWCRDCGALIHKRYEKGGQVPERVLLPARMLASTNRP